MRALGADLEYLAGRDAGERPAAARGRALMAWRWAKAETSAAARFPRTESGSSVKDGRSVVLGAGDDLEYALKKLKRQQETAGLTETLRRHVAHLSPGRRRRLKHHRHLARLRRSARKRALAIGE